jgi:catechol 2,3-dioxygenase-like lactoylglutathione lyase family enzyme
MAHGALNVHLPVRQRTERRSDEALKPGMARPPVVRHDDRHTPDRRRRRMLDHVGLDVSDYERSKAFYERALAPLGLELMMEPVPGVGGFGDGRKPFFWVRARGRPPQRGVHVAFAVDDRATVDAFHAAALEAGGTDNGGPGVRERYHPSYYGAYVLDPDGNNVEAVCHKPA